MMSKCSHIWTLSVLLAVWHCVQISDCSEERKLFSTPLVFSKKGIQTSSGVGVNLECGVRGKKINHCSWHVKAIAGRFERQRTYMVHDVHSGFWSSRGFRKPDSLVNNQCGIFGSYEYPGIWTCNVVLVNGVSLTGRKLVSFKDKSIDRKLIPNFSRKQIFLNPDAEVDLKCGYEFKPVRSCHWEHIRIPKDERKKKKTAFSIDDMYNGKWSWVSKSSSHSTKKNQCGIRIKSHSFLHGTFKCTVIANNDEVWTRLEWFQRVTKTFERNLTLEGYVDVFITEKPQKPVLNVTENPLIVLEDAIVKISCTVGSSRPRPKFKWFIGPEDLTLKSSTKYQEIDKKYTYKSISTLRFKIDRNYDQMNLRCSIEHDTLTEPEYSEITLKLERSLIFSNQTMIANSGSTLLLNCGINFGFEFCLWEHQQSQRNYYVRNVYDGYHPGMSSYPDILGQLGGSQCGIAIQNVTESINGTWTCKIFRFGNTIIDSKDVIFTTGQATPQSLIFNNETMIGTYEEILSLECGHTSLPSDGICKWEHEGKETILVENVHNGKEPGISKPANYNINQCGIVINKASEKTNGKWTCVFRSFLTGDTLESSKEVVVTDHYRLTPLVFSKQPVIVKKGESRRFKCGAHREVSSCSWSYQNYKMNNGTIGLFGTGHKIITVNRFKGLGLGKECNFRIGFFDRTGTVTCTINLVYSVHPLIGTRDYIIEGKEKNQSPLFFNTETIIANIGDKINLECGISAEYHSCSWELLRYDFNLTMEVKDIYNGLVGGLSEPINSIDNQCGIVIDSVESTKRHGTWVCNIYPKGHKLGKILRRSRDVIVTVKPQKPVIDIADNPLVVVEASEIEISCKVASARPPPKFKWFMSNEDVTWKSSTNIEHYHPPTDSSVFVSSSVSTVRIKIHYYHDEMKLRCSIEHPSLTEPEYTELSLKLQR